MFCKNGNRTPNLLLTEPRFLHSGNRKIGRLYINVGSSNGFIRKIIPMGYDTVTYPAL